MHPKNTGEEALPNFKAIADRKIEAILISHGHQDHIGTLPVLMRRQPAARIFMTETTAEIGSVLLHSGMEWSNLGLKRVGSLAMVPVAPTHVDLRRTRTRAGNRRAHI